MAKRQLLGGKRQSPEPLSTMQSHTRERLLPNSAVSPTDAQPRLSHPSHLPSQLRSLEGAIALLRTHAKTQVGTSPHALKGTSPLAPGQGSAAEAELLDLVGDSLILSGPAAAVDDATLRSFLSGALPTEQMEAVEFSLRTRPGIMARATELEQHRQSSFESLMDQLERLADDD